MKRRSFIREICILSAAPTIWIPRVRGASLTPSQLSPFFQQPAAGGSPVPDIYWNKYPDGAGAVSTAAVGPNFDLLGSYSWVTGQSGSGFAVTLGSGGANANTTAAVTYGTNLITLCTWLYPIATDSTRFLFESSVNAGTTPDTFAAYINGGNLIGYVSGTTGARAESIAAPATGAWVHIGVVLDNSTATGNVKIYLDAVEQVLNLDVDTKTGTSNYAADTLYVSARAGASFFMDATFDDTRIYSGDQGANMTAIMNDSQ